MISITKLETVGESDTLVVYLSYPRLQKVIKGHAVRALAGVIQFFTTDKVGIDVVREVR